MDYQVKIGDGVREIVKPVFVIMSIFEISFIVLSVFVFNNLISVRDNENLVVVVDDSLDGGEIPAGVWDNVNAALYDIVSLNSSTGQNMPTSGALLRDGTLFTRHFDGDRADGVGFSYVSFIVDIPKIEQSYWVQYEQSDEYTEEDVDNEWIVSPVIACPLKSEILYSSFNCTDRFGGFVRNSLVSKYLGYENFENFYAYIDEKNMDQIRIVSRYYEHTTEQDAEYIEKVREFVESLGIPTDLFEYYIVPTSELEIL